MHGREQVPRGVEPDGEEAELKGAEDVADLAKGGAVRHVVLVGVFGHVAVAGVAGEEEFFGLVRGRVVVVDGLSRGWSLWRLGGFQHPGAPERGSAVKDAAAGEMLRGRAGQGDGAEAGDVDAGALPPVQLRDGVVRDAEASEPRRGIETHQEMDVTLSPGEGFQQGVRVHVVVVIVGDGDQVHIR